MSVYLVMQNMEYRLRVFNNIGSELRKFEKNSFVLKDKISPCHSATNSSSKKKTFEVSSVNEVYVL